MNRELRFVEMPNFVGWTCSLCEWRYQVPLPLEAATEESLVAEANELRDRDFQSHICSRNQDPKNPKVSWLHLPRYDS